MVINRFLEDNNIKLKNLTEEPFYMEKSLKYWKKEEFASLQFNIEKNEYYKIDTSMIKNKFYSGEAVFKTKISKPLISNDAKKALIGIEETSGLYENLTIYLLKKNKNEWILETSINSTRTLSH